MNCPCQDAAAGVQGFFHPWTLHPLSASALHPAMTLQNHRTSSSDWALHKTSCESLQRTPLTIKTAFLLHVSGRSREMKEELLFDLDPCDARRAERAQTTLYSCTCAQGEPAACKRRSLHLPHRCLCTSDTWRREHREGRTCPSHSLQRSHTPKDRREGGLHQEASSFPSSTALGPHLVTLTTT